METEFRSSDGFDAFQILLSRTLSFSEIVSAAEIAAASVAIAAIAAMITAIIIIIC